MDISAIGRGKLILAFGAIYFVWGTTYLANLYALQAIPPFVISALRYLVAGLLLAALACRRGQAFPKKGSEIQALAISGIIMLVGGSGLVVVAEQYISSGATAVIVATEPLWFVLLDKARWRHYFGDKRIVAGLLIGFAGVALFAQFAPADASSQHQAGYQLVGTVLVLLSALLWVIGTLFAARRVPAGNYSLWYTTIQLLAAGLFAAVVALVNGEWQTFTLQAVSLPAWGGLVFLIIFGSLVAYLAFAWLITVQPPALVSTHTFVNPLVAVLVGWLVAGEQVSVGQGIALAIVLVGVVLSQLGKVRSEG